MSPLLRSYAVAVIALLDGCANDVSCACPAIGPRPPIEANPGALAFGNVGPTFEKTVAITSTESTAFPIVETDDCSAGAAPIATIALPKTAVTPVNATITPVSPGSCTILFQTPGRGGISVFVTVSSAT